MKSFALFLATAAVSCCCTAGAFSFALPRKNIRDSFHHDHTKKRTPTYSIAALRMTADTAGSNSEQQGEISAVNVLGTPLQCCCADVQGSGIGTGFYRNGYCATGESDVGRHTACVLVTDEFLAFSKSVGSDLTTPVPHYFFPGLEQGDIWCLCALRWVHAYNAGMAPKLFLQATHEKTLSYVPFEILREYAIDQEEADRRLAELNEKRKRLNKLL
jgi:uncharacterized protein (DUF2237 family)